jgi:hypothetical protein
MNLNITQALKNSDRYVDIGFSGKALISLVTRKSVVLLASYVCIILLAFGLGLYIVLTFSPEDHKRFRPRSTRLPGVYSPTLKINAI